MEGELQPYHGTGSVEGGPQPYHGTGSMEGGPQVYHGTDSVEFRGRSELETQWPQ